MFAVGLLRNCLTRISQPLPLVATTRALANMSQYTTVEKGAPNSTNFRIFYSK